MSEQDKREKRLLEVEAKRKEILAEGERGRGLFTTRYSLPSDHRYSGVVPLFHLMFTVSLSRKYDDTFYLYRLDTYDGEAYDNARGQAKCEGSTSDAADRRAIELLKEGVEITPCFTVCARKGGKALVEVVGTVDVYCFSSDGVAKAIAMFLDNGEVNYKGAPFVHKASKGFLLMLEKEIEAGGISPYYRDHPHR
ncbi:MAG: hypothetical protein FWG59_07045 [Betaproteobacteria bacterium]|nr:hypothetical protein [Betaproteobacteria bacterium]